ncbi:MAG: hypothetical protein B7733_07395, partial [Myxococcales bacterium FL481]
MVSPSHVHAAEQVRAVASAFLRARPWIVAPAMVITLTAVSRVDGVTTDRLGLMSFGMGTMMALFVGEAIVCRRREVTERWLAVSLALTTIGIAAMCLLTGAIRSPTLVLLCAPVAIGFAAFGRSRTALAIAALALAWLSGLAWLPPDWPFPRLPAPAQRTVAWVATAVTLALFLAGVGGLREGFAAAIQRADRLRRDTIEGA